MADIKKLAHEVYPYVVEMRRDFHRHPEASFEEFRTTKRIAEELDKMGIPYRLFEPTGLVGEIKGGKPGKCIALRADIDALTTTEKTGLPYASENEDYMHACGHDTHTAMLLGAAQLRCLPRGALILDLASRPGGTDFAAARELGLRAEHALSLPARCAPETAGALVAHTVEVILQERAATARSERGVS